MSSAVSPVARQTRALKATGKAKATHISPPTSEAEDSDTQMVGTSRKRKRKTKKPSSKAPGLKFDQFPLDVQKQLMKQALKAYTQKKNASAAADAEIQHTNDRLLAEDSMTLDVEDQINGEDSDSRVEAGGLDEEDELDKEEQQLAAGLSSLRKAVPKVDKTAPNVDSPNQTLADYKTDNSGGEGIGSGNWSDDNGMDVKIMDSKISRVKKARCSTPPSSNHSTTSTSRSNKTRKAGRIVEEDFNPLARQVAIAAKSHFRVLTIYDTPFPPQGVGRFEYGWKAIKAMVHDSKNPKWKTVLKWADDVESEHPQQLVKFAMYGRSGLLSGIVAKAREKLPSFYSLSGSRATIKADIEWLIEDSHFIFGAVDLKHRTFDNATPFDSELIVQVIQSQWFPSSNRQKADLETAARVYADQKIPIAMVLLTITAIEHVLHEWSSGARPSVPQMFSEESAKTSYIGFEEAWNQIAAASPGWKAQWPRKLYQTISQDFIHLPSGSGALGKPLPAINFQKLNAGYTVAVADQAPADDAGAK